MSDNKKDDLDYSGVALLAVLLLLVVVVAIIYIYIVGRITVFIINMTYSRLLGVGWVLINYGYPIFLLWYNFYMQYSPNFVFVGIELYVVSLMIYAAIIAYHIHNNPERFKVLCIPNYLENCPHNLKYNTMNEERDVEYRSTADDDIPTPIRMVGMAGLVGGAFYLGRKLGKAMV